MKIGEFSAAKETSVIDELFGAREGLIRGGLCLLPGEGFVKADLLLADGKIAEIRRGGTAAGSGINAAGCLVLPGIVDIHGDAFERQIMPRPKTLFPLDVAFLETDRQLAANGITTAYHGVTVSWEPGLRSLEQALAIIEALDRLKPELLCDHRLHLRWETFALDEMEAVKALFARAHKPLLAFNDHTTPTLRGSRADIKIKSAAERAMIDESVYMALLEKAAARMADVSGAISDMAVAARAHGVPMLSHDDRTAAERHSYRALGAGIAEFPMKQEALEAAAQAGDSIVLGAPNVVRGGSHNGALGAEQAIREERCTILASDYYYPAPLRAALLLAERNALPLERGWELIAANPAAACGLDDRGRITEGCRADLILLPEFSPRPALVVAAGRIVHAGF
ncbi:MAG: alpha-D-ribose 1-methylphosphonate 5-triphosphate diphosphatase [Aestuariivirga sp.]|uniref:alpha-D-ribose 1-methylphosphonate 5-triphosphate diphosphatase n=1 Tax=Aestuariivirga sp. TaxID=2650926 RepID=UPI0038D03168